jgi:hypothetical protein
VRTALITAYDDYARIQRARFDAMGERLRAVLGG